MIIGFDNLQRLQQLLNGLVSLSCLLSLFIFHHQILDLLHAIRYVKCNVDGVWHFIGAFDTHAQDLLHLFELIDVGFFYLDGFSFSFCVDLIDELNNCARTFLCVLAKYRSNHEIPDVGACALVVYLFHVLCFFDHVVWIMDFSWFEDWAWDTSVCWKIQELLCVNFTYSLSLFFLGHVWIQLFLVIVYWLLCTFLSGFFCLLRCLCGCVGIAF